jgi:hypothetical protein
LPPSIRFSNEIAGIRERGLGGGMSDDELAGLVEREGAEGAVGRLVGV